jgi:Lrp/AsnC family transcriptional regulator, leucine-responsive regulatory protein
MERLLEISQVNDVMVPELDEVDLEILRLLQADGRATHAAIGKVVGLTGPSVYSRVRRMEREGVIRGYTTLLDPSALQQTLVAYMRVGTHADAHEQGPFEDFVRGEPQILECHDVDGEDSYVVKIRTATPQTLRGLLARIRAIPGVTRTVTSIALLTIKEPGATGRLVDPEVPRGTNTDTEGEGLTRRSGSASCSAWVRHSQSARSSSPSCTPQRPAVSRPH